MVSTVPTQINFDTVFVTSDASGSIPIFYDMKTQKSWIFLYLMTGLFVRYPPQPASNLSPGALYIQYLSFLTTPFFLCSGNLP